MKAMYKQLVSISLWLVLLPAGFFYFIEDSAFSGETEPPTALSHLDALEPDLIDWKAKDSAYWQKVLSDKQYRVCRAGGTEPPFSGTYNKYKKEGMYICSSCGLPLFSSDTKFDSGTGWPSFTQPVSENAVTLELDRSFGMLRTEVTCSRCGAHLGHVFDDGPQPTGKRYCINSVCLLHR